MITHLHVEGYRSIRSLDLDLRSTNVILGPNGSGKTNAEPLASVFADLAGTPAIKLEKIDGETRVVRQASDDD
jgi:predicted ATPase